MRSRSAPPALRMFGFLCMLAFGVALLVLSVREYAIGRALMGNGELTNGLMLGRTGAITRTFAYEFTAPGANGRSLTFRGELTVSGKKYNRAQRAKAVTVRYLRSDPNISRVVDFWSPSPLWVVAIFCVLWGLLIVGGVTGLRDVAREKGGRRKGA